jgi:hypothetical protein
MKDIYKVKFEYRPRGALGISFLKGELDFQAIDRGEALDQVRDFITAEAYKNYEHFSMISVTKEGE